MSFDQLLMHTCTIQNPRKTDGKTLNAYNNVKPAFDAPLENVRCRLVESRVRVWSDDHQEAMVQSVYKLMVPADTVLDKRAEISLITLEDGMLIRDKFVVTELYTRRARSARHMTAILERIS
jgi:hypothetical protein